LAISLGEGEEDYRRLSYHPEEVTELDLGMSMKAEDKAVSPTSWRAGVMIAGRETLVRALASPPNVLLKRETIKAAAERHGLLAGRILNVGSRNVRLGADSINLDIVPGDGVDVVGDAHELERHFPEKSFDTVVLSAVLQYCENPQRVIQQAHYVLKPGGMLLLDAPFLQPYCPDGLDLWRFSDAGLRRLCEKHFEIVELNPSFTMGSSVAFILQRAFTTRKNRVLAALSGWLVTMAVYPLRYFRGNDGATAGAFLLVGRKSPDCEATSTLPTISANQARIAPPDNAPRVWPASFLLQLATAAIF
jgi:SAM-dependent methyltransferase